MTIQSLNAHIVYIALCFMLITPLSASAQPSQEATRVFTNATIISMDASKPDAFTGYMAIDARGRISAIGEGAPLPGCIECCCCQLAACAGVRGDGAPPGY